MVKLNIEANKYQTVVNMLKMGTLHNNIKYLHHKYYVQKNVDVFYIKMAQDKIRVDTTRRDFSLQ